MHRATSSKLDASPREVVYGHRIQGDDSYFHSGSGSEHRARHLAGRSSLWRTFVTSRGGIAQIMVEIIERHRCPARARIREMELVYLQQPSTNTFGRRRPFPPSIVAGRPKGSKERCACNAPDCYGAEIAAK